MSKSDRWTGICPACNGVGQDMRIDKLEFCLPCPECEGIGWVTDSELTKEDHIVNQHQERKDCEAMMVSERK